MTCGICKFYNHSKGYGFLSCIDESSDQGFDVFFHNSGLIDPSDPPRKSEECSFEISEDERRHQPIAINIKRTPRPQSSSVPVPGLDHSPEVEAVLGQQLTGRISTYRQFCYGFIAIDSEIAPGLRKRSIYFQERDCVGRFTPNIGDRVSATLIHTEGGLRFVDVRLLERVVPSEHIAPV